LGQGLGGEKCWLEDPVEGRRARQNGDREDGVHFLSLSLKNDRGVIVSGESNIMPLLCNVDRKGSVRGEMKGSRRTRLSRNGRECDATFGDLESTTVECSLSSGGQIVNGSVGRRVKNTA
jgi:hypothetical protein